MKCPYCKDDLLAVADGTTEWRCTECDTWIAPIELKRAADGACPWCGISTSAPHPHDLVRDLRTALGWPDIAIPQPPKAVWAEALAEVRRLRHNDPDTEETK